MDVHLFIPGIERYFKHFSPTLSLINPYCTPQQLSYFLSLFPNLDDIAIREHLTRRSNTAKAAKFVPLSAPKLRGRLVLYDSDQVDTWTYLASRGGLRYVELRKAMFCAPCLLRACAESLVTLRLDVEDCSSCE